MKTLKKIGVYLFVFSLIVLPLVAHAQIDAEEPGSSGSGASGGDIIIPNPLKGGVNDFMSLLVLVLNTIIMPIAAIAIVVFIIYSGFMFVMAQGNPTKIAEAKQRLLWGLIGGGIILAAAGISEVVKTTINQLVK